MKHPLDYNSEFMFWLVSLGGSVVGGLALAAVILFAIHVL